MGSVQESPHLQIWARRASLPDAPMGCDSINAMMRNFGAKNPECSDVLCVDELIGPFLQINVLIGASSDSEGDAGWC